MKGLPIPRSRSRRSHRIAGSAASLRVMLLLLGASYLSQVLAAGAADTTLLQGSNVTEANLLNALTPSNAVATRSLRVRPSGAGVPAPVRKPSASLLITFQTNSAELTPSARQQLDVVGVALKNERLAEFNFNVEGHADPRGNASANLALSRDRANSVRDYLVSTQGIGADRLIPEGKGSRELLNTVVPAAPENRRVTIVTNVQ